MNTRFKKILSVLFTAAILLTAAPLGSLAGLDINIPDFSVESSALEASGYCGQNVRWSLDGEYNLAVFGSGAMQDYIKRDDGSSTSPFYGDTSIQTVRFDLGVTRIGNYAFYSCSGLKKVTMADSVTSIGKGAFLGCSELNEVIIGSGVVSIEDYTFQNCKKLKSLVIPPNVQSISYSAGNFNNEIKIYCYPGTYAETFAAKLGSNYWYLVPEGESAFLSHTVSDNLSFTLDRVTHTLTVNCEGAMPSYTDAGNAPWYQYARYIEHVVVSEGCTSIGGSAFKSIPMTDVSLPSTLKSIGDYAFKDCVNLKEIVIPSPTTTIGNSAFSNCKQLSSVTLNEGLESIGASAFTNCCLLNEIEFPDSLVSVGNSTFSNAGIGMVKFGTGLKNISDYMFYSCYLMSVEIPESVESIGYKAFYNSYCDVDDPFILKVYNRNCAISSDPVEYSSYYSDSDYPPPNTGLIVYGYADSTAHHFALENNLTFRYIYGEHDHTYDNSCDTTCNICGQTRTVSHDQFSYIIAQSSNGAYKVYKCTQCGARICKKNGITGHFSSYGENVFGFRDENYKWTFFGTGATYDYSYGEVNASPFNPDFGGSKVNEAVFEEGITYIGDYFFSDSSVSKVTFPSTLESISSNAFSFTAIDTITFAEGTRAVNTQLLKFFDYDSNVVNLPSSVEEIYGTLPTYSNFISKVYYDGNRDDWAKIQGHELLEKYEIIYLKPLPITSISVTTMPRQTTYHVNSDFKSSGMVVTGTSDGGSTEIITDYGFEYNFSTPGQQEVTISYNGLSTTITVSVVEHILEHRVINATCSTTGEESDICTYCGERFNVTVLPTVPDEHAFQRLFIAATCSEKGRVYDRCTLCGEEVTVSELPTTPHTFSRTVEEPATCTHAGRTYDVCSVCNQEYNITEYPQLSHNYVHFKQDMTCTQTGIEYDYCTLCGAKINEVITPAPGHDIIHFSKAVTCTQDGKEYDFCTVCGEKLNEVIYYATGHKFIHYSTPKTCTTDGNSYDVCSVCNKTFNYTVDKATGHNFRTITVNPTCTKNGMRFDYCLVCEEQQNVEILPASHSWSEWHNVSVSGDGILIVRSCDKCSEAQTKTVANIFDGCTVKNSLISGLAPGMTFEDFRSNYINSDADVTFSRNDGKIGTGEKITVNYDDETQVEFECLIYGDVDGDGIYDAQDAFIVNCIANGILTREKIGETKYMAADCNHDGEVNSIDVMILEQAGLLLSEIEQSESSEETAQQQSYLDYLDLIDQSPEKDEALTATEQSFIEKIVSVIRYIISIIRSIIEI